MSSYFDEHDCQPLRDGETPNHALHLARLLIDGGYAREWQMEYDSMFGNGQPAPPASKKAVENLPKVQVTEAQEEQDMKCPVCLLEYNAGQTCQKMPCEHQFHPTCILPWLERTNSCPVCRYELPTDDPNYEEYKKQKARQAQRDYELESLHDSMFG